MKVSNLFILLLVTLLSSCVSITNKLKEPTDSNDTLLVGRLVFKCLGTNLYTIPTGDYRSGIKIEFFDQISGDVIIVYSYSKYGFFKINNPDISSYIITEIMYEAPLGGVVLIEPVYDNRFIIKKGKVNNLGLLTWTGNLPKFKHITVFNKEYEETRNLFFDKYSRSLWNKKEWVNLKGR